MRPNGISLWQMRQRPKSGSSILDKAMVKLFNLVSAFFNAESLMLLLLIAPILETRPIAFSVEMGFVSYLNFVTVSCVFEISASIFAFISDISSGLSLI
tara:strand:- start:115405 stop:115701 length:297 start_codon:yes stop_codon:yes gene_type:complete